MNTMTLAVLYSQISKMTVCNISHISGVEKKLSGFRIWDLLDTKVLLLYKIINLPPNTHRLSTNVFELHIVIVGSSPEGLFTSWNLLVMWCTNMFNNYELYVLSTLYLCVLCLSENKGRLVPLTQHKLVIITKMNSVYCAVRAGSLNKIVCAPSLKG